MPFLFHVIGFTFWTSGLLGSCQLLRSAHREDDSNSSQRLKLAAKKFLRMADIGAFLAIGGGAYEAWFRAAYQLHWFTIKLVLLAGILAVHVLLHIKARKDEPAKPLSAAYPWTVAVLVIAVIYIALSKPTFG